MITKTKRIPDATLTCRVCGVDRRHYFVGTQHLPDRAPMYLWNCRKCSGTRVGGKPKGVNENE